jgi:hypothetical protein
VRLFHRTAGSEPGAEEVVFEVLPPGTGAPRARRHERIGSWLVCTAYQAGSTIAAARGVVVNISPGGAALISPDDLGDPDRDFFLELATDDERQLVPCFVVGRQQFPGMVQYHVAFNFASDRQAAFVRRVVDELTGQEQALRRAA